MAEAEERKKKGSTALGAPVTFGQSLEGAEVQIGRPPVVLQVQPHSFVPLERPEQLRQFEEDLRLFYGITVEADAMRGHACETCSCGCSDDCGFM